MYAKIMFLRLPPPARVNQEVEDLKAEILKLRSKMVMKIDLGPDDTVKRIKGLVTRAKKLAAIEIEHWNVDEGAVYVRLVPGAPRPRGRPRKKPA